MAEKLIWVCDGCDAEQVIVGSRSYHWKRVTADISGLAGYPTCRPEPAATMHWILCPDCAERFYLSMAPSRWDRPTKAA